MSCKVDKNIKLLELHTILLSGMFVIPVVVPYYRDEIGLDFHDFMMGEVAFAVAMLLFEVPSGWISDVWKRKYVLMIGSLFDLVGFVILLSAHNLFMVMLAQVIVGIAMSLYSGTNTALLYDSLLEKGAEGDFARLEGRRGGFGLYAVGVSSIIGGFLYVIDHRFPFYATIIALILSLLAVLFIVEPERHKEEIRSNPFKDIVETVRYAVHGHIVVGLIILFSSVLFCATKLNMWIQQPYYIELNISEAWFGVLMAFGYISGGASSHLSHLLFRKTRNIKALTYIWMLIMAVVFLAAVHVGFHGIVMLMVGGSFIYGMAQPKFREAINIRVGSERRATILSTASLLQQIGFIPLGLIASYVTDKAGVSAGLYTSFIWLAVSGVFLIIWSKYNIRRKRAV